MTKSFYFIITLLCSFLIYVGCQSKSKEQPAASLAMPTENMSWHESMSQLKSSLTDLLPGIVDPVEFNKPKQLEITKVKVSEMAKIARVVKHNSFTQQADPSLKFIAKAFQEQIVKIDESLHLNRLDYARYSLLNLSSYCIQCHTRTAIGPQFNSQKLDLAVANLNELDKGEYYLAIREYEKAYNSFKTFLKQSTEKPTQFTLIDKALRYGLSVTVKSLRDPDKGLELVSIIEGASHTPFYLKQNAMGWKKALIEWKNEPKPRSTSVDAVLTRVRGLVRKGLAQHEVVADRIGDIYFLRALADLHLLILGDVKKEKLAESMYLIGLCYESLKDLSMWSLHEDYYESCINTLPKSSWSALCYKKLEESVYLGYTGSSGTHLPDEARELLERLKLKAL